MLSRNLLAITSLTIIGLGGCATNTPQTSWNSPHPVYIAPSPPPSPPTSDLKRIALSERSAVIGYYNTCQYSIASQRIKSWKMQNETLRSSIIQTSGDTNIFYNIAIAFDMRDSLQNLKEMSAGNVDETTDTIIGAAENAWFEYRNWLNCYLSERIKRNCIVISPHEIRASICQNFKRSLISKYPPAQQLID